MLSAGILACAIDETPLTVIDLETTGLVPGADRVVEVSAVRAEARSEPRLLLDTLVNPQRPVAATEIHGIRDEDVADAPRFGEVAGDLIRAAAGTVIASYNVYFDVNFLDCELRQVGMRASPPHVCLMYLRPLLGLGRKCSLQEACKAHGLEHTTVHMTSADALAAARLAGLYFAEMRARGVRTYSDLARAGKYKFISSFSRPLLDPQAAAPWPPCPRVKSRAARSSVISVGAEAGKGAQKELQEYWDALTTAVADLEVTDEEIGELGEKKRELGLTDDQVRALHARVFAGALTRMTDDERLSETEARSLRRLRFCLRELGWSPGD